MDEPRAVCAVTSPAAEIAIDDVLVRTLLVEQHPDLAELPLSELEAGWDNSLWRLGNDLLVRLPRRAVAAPLILNEQRWLPDLAPLLPLPVSAPVRIGGPSSDYPWSWSIVPWREGAAGDRSSITDPVRAAEDLGRFLRVLHHAAPANAPANPFRGVPLARRAALFEERIAGLAKEIDVRATRTVWERARAAVPWSGPATWLHGDLHPGNVVISNGSIAGIIDFGDICAGDPATDLAAGWMLLPSSSIAIFLDAYGGIDAELEARALGWSILFGLMLLAIGLGDRPSYEPIGRATLSKAIEHS